MAEAMSTLAHTTGQPDGPPTLPPIALADEVTGMRGAFAVLAALRHRDLTGYGQVIDISLLESLVDMVGPGPAIYHRTGQSDGRIGSRLCFSAPRNIYQCSDGHIVLSGSANQVALRVFDAIGRGDLRSDPRFTTGRARIENVELLDRIITNWTSAHTVDRGDRDVLGRRRRSRPRLRRRGAGERPPRGRSARASSRLRARPEASRSCSSTCIRACR